MFGVERESNVKQIRNIIIGPAFPLRGGIANFNEALCRSFNQAGVNSKIYSFSLQYPDFLFPGKTQYDKSSSKPSSFKIETLINSINPFTWFKTAKLIKKENPDYIIIRYWLPFMAPCLGTIARLVKRKTTIKIIVIADNILPHEKRFGDDVLTKYFVKSCHAFIVMSSHVMDDLKKFIPNPIAVFLPHPIYDIFGEKISRNEALQHLSYRNTFNYLLFFGFIRKYKGLDLLLEAMSDPRIRSKNIKLIVAGECYEDILFYKNIVKANKIESNVLFKADYIPSSEVKNYFCAADMIVQPYRAATQSGVTQIAYHFEKPMLVTDVGGLPEIIPHLKAGYVVKPAVNAIADAIVHFYDNKMQEQFTENVKIEKKRFLWSTFIDGVNSLYQNL